MKTDLQLKNDVLAALRWEPSVTMGDISVATWTAPDLPFGGIKNSGYGRELSSLGIHEFVNKKLVRVESINVPA